MGRLTAQADGAGDTTSYTYGATGLELTMTDPLGHRGTYQCDALGRQTLATDALKSGLGQT